MLTAPFKSCWRLKLGLHGEVCLHLAKDKAFNSLSPTLATRYCEIRRSDEFFASFQGVTPFGCTFCYVFSGCEHIICLVGNLTWCMPLFLEAFDNKQGEMPR